MSDTLLLVDAHHQIYRAFFALPSMAAPNGQPVNAIYGFMRMLRKWLNEHRPTHCAAVFDLGLPVQRRALYSRYKTKRPPIPVDMEAQIPKIREMLEAMHIPIVERDGEEADDLIASLAFQSAQKAVPVFIASNDKDFAQLVAPLIRLIRSERHGTAVIDASGVIDRFGVLPTQIVDLLCLVGDSVDDIPGVPGVGEKTGKALIQQFGNIEKMLADPTNITRQKLRENILSSAGQLRINRLLIELHTDIKLDVSMDDMKLKRPDYQKLTALFENCGFSDRWPEVEKKLHKMTHTHDIWPD